MYIFASLVSGIGIEIDMKLVFWPFQFFFNRTTLFIASVR